MLMILSLSVVYAAPAGLWPLLDYGPCRTMASAGLWPLPDYGLLPDYGPLPDYASCRTLASAGLWPPPGQSKVFAV